MMDPMEDVVLLLCPEGNGMLGGEGLCQLLADLGLDRMLD